MKVQQVVEDLSEKNTKKVVRRLNYSIRDKNSQYKTKLN